MIHVCEKPRNVITKLGNLYTAISKWENYKIPVH